MSKAVNAQNYDFEEDRGTLADMNAGKDAGGTIDAGDVGELAEVELGAPDQGVYSEFDVLSLGGIPDAQLQTKQARVDGNLQGDQDGDGTLDDVPAGTKVRLRLTDKRRNKTYDSSRWMDKSEIQAGSIENLPVLKWDGRNGRAEWVGEGRVIVLEGRNASSSFVVSVADSTFEFPFIGGI